MPRMMIIPENLMALSQARVAAGSEASATMADDNLLTEEPSEFWRSTNNAPTSVVISAGLTDIDTTANALAIIGHNLYRGDQYRVVVGATSPAGFAVVLPNETVSSVNVTGPSTPDLHFDVDDGETFDGDWITPIVAATNWSIIFGFNAPGGTPTAGANLQAFCVYVKSATTPAHVEKAATLTCDLFFPGGFIRTLGTKSISASGGQLVFFPWDIDTLAAADVQVRLTCSGSAACYLSVGSAFWAAEYPAVQGGTSVGGTWATYNPFVGTGIAYLPEAKGQGSAILVQFGSTLSFRHATLYIRSDHAPSDYDYTKEILPVVPGYVQIGVIIIGETWSPAHDIQNGPFIGARDASSKGRTYGGQSFGSRRFVQRILSMPLAILTPEEAHTLFDRVIWRHGILKKFFVALMPGDATEGKHTGFLASLKNAEHTMLTTPAEARNRSMILEWEEEL